MLNTHRYQSTRNVLARRDRSANAQRTRSVVRQDNPTPPRARIASPQPAPPKNEMRPTPKKLYTVRTQQGKAKKRKTVHLTIWVRPVVKAELERIAKQEGLSTSTTGAAFLEKALQQNLHSQHTMLLDTVIEKAIARHMRSYSTRIAVL